jgi:hypothetical protein
MGTKMGAKRIAATLALLCGASLPAIAGPAILFSPTDTPDPTAPALPTCNTSCNYGFSFFLPSGIETVRGLGAYDAGSKSGLTGAAQVGLWVDDGNGGGILIASTTVPAGSAGTQIGDFSYNGIVPVTLQAMTLYYIASYQPSDPVVTFQNADYSSPPIDPDLTVNADAYGVVPDAAVPDPSNLVFPGLSVGTVGADLGANFTDDFVPIYSGLPEPTTLAILGASLAGFAASRRRIARK